MPHSFRDESVGRTPGRTPGADPLVRAGSSRSLRVESAVCGPGRPGEFFHVKGAFATIASAPLPLGSDLINTEAPRYAFLKAWQNLSGPRGFQGQNQTLGRDHSASR
jgi:hypothetical protein